MRRAAILMVVTVSCPIVVATHLWGGGPLVDSPSPDPAPRSVMHERNQLAKVALLGENLPGSDGQLVRALAGQLRSDGFEVTQLSAEQVCDKNVLSADRFFLYVIPRCQTYPAAGLEALRAFAEGRGHLLLLGGPFLDDPLWRGDRGWLNREAVMAAKRNVHAAHRPFAVDTLNTTGWMRTCSDVRSRGTWEVVPEGPQEALCFRFSTTNLTGWDGYLSPPIANLYGDHDDLLTFLARGDAHTPQLAIEIQESDGSRWIAVTEISTAWQRISLEPRDFVYWPDSSTRDRRGKVGDALNPAQARRINFQLAQSHTLAVAPGDHVFWVADVGTCSNPVAEMQISAPAADISLESILPRYKVVHLQESLTLRPSADGQGLRGTAGVSSSDASAGDIICAIPRTMGRGFLREQKWRYVPLLDALDSQGRRRGNPAWMLLNHTAPYEGSVFACLGVNDPNVLSSSKMLQVVGSMARRLAQGVFLQEAGSEHFAYWPEEQIRIGAAAVNVNMAQRSVALRVTLRDAQGNVQFTKTAPLELAGQQQAEWQEALTLRSTQPAVYTVMTELVCEDAVVDRIDHEFAVLDTRPHNSSEFMSVQGNNFCLNGKSWYPVGINFWPLYVSGMDHGDYWAGWIQRPYYDPQLVEEDLVRMQALGINMVSIQSNDPKFYRNLLDFIRRCGRHDIYVNLFCGLASPLGFREEELRQFIETARLADNPTIMAYDTIWEPGNYVFQGDRRAGWDDDWRDWVIEQYGSTSAAESEWGFTGRRDDARSTHLPARSIFPRRRPLARHDGRLPAFHGRFDQPQVEPGASEATPDGSAIISSVSARGTRCRMTSYSPAHRNTSTSFARKGTPSRTAKTATTWQDSSRSTSTLPHEASPLCGPSLGRACGTRRR